MTYRASARVSALLRARVGASQALESPVARSLQAGWRGLAPKLARLNKADTVIDVWLKDWADEFEAAYLSGLEAAAKPLAQAEAQAWRDYKVTFDSAAIADGYYKRIGENITGDIKAVTLNKIREKVALWRADENLSLSGLADSLSYWFSPERAWLIAVNETTQLVSYSTREAMRQMELERWTWQSRQEWNTCSQCRALHGQVFTVRDMMPPDGSHIGCFCVPAPILE